jgi:hypothetical protein
MTTTPLFTTNHYGPVSFIASQVSQVAAFTVSQHPRHVRVTGSVTYIAYQTNVVGDDGILLGIVAAYPAVAPPIPSEANAASWVPGFWGRPNIVSTEECGSVAVPNNFLRRTYFDVEFDYEPDNGGAAGALYMGHAAIYVDANHSLPLVGASVTTWGYGA